MVLTTSSSVEPVGAPTTVSLVRTTVTPESRSDWISAALKRHSVMREDTSALVVLDASSLELRLRSAAAPVELVDELVAPIVLLGEVVV